MTTTNRSETFGRLLKAGIASIANCEGKTAPVIEDELGEQIGIAGKSIQRYKSGYLPPDPRTVQIIAEACVRRGMLDREWLQKFLHAARYPFAERLLDALCPAPQARPRPPRVYENLPAPTYSQFVMREQAFAEVIDGLGQRSAAVLIVGMGGNGKTSLAREAAARCLRGDGDAPPFDSVVWVSDKDRPGTTNLSTVLDEIARTLDYPGFTQFAHDEKRHEVEQLLRRQRVLLVIDNFETITDGALLSWLLRLPEPSKALITSREYRREWRSSWPVELRGMSEAEAHALVRQRLRHLRIEALLSDAVQLDPLIAATGGNPKAIEITLGLVKYERRPLQQVVDDLYAARGELFDDLFARSWALLDEAARRVLLVATFFPSSASVEALSASADVQGFAFDRAVERLVDLALLDVQQADLSSPPRYALHPLVRAFAGAKFTARPGFEAEARVRWVNWYANLTERVGSCWDDLSRLEILDPEQDAIFGVIQWAWSHNAISRAIQLIDGSRYYYNVRGYWDKRLMLTRLRLEASCHNTDPDLDEVVRSLAYYIEALCKQGKIEEATALIPEFHRNAEVATLQPSNELRYHHTLAIYEVARRNALAADEHLLHAAPLALNLGGQSPTINLRWRAISAYVRGDLLTAEELFLQSLADAITIDDRRSVIGNTIHLAAIDIDLGRIESAGARLEDAYSQVDVIKDRRRRSELLPLVARLHALRNDLPAARAAYAEAIDLFERLGMRRELAEAHQALAEIGAGAGAEG